MTKRGDIIKRTALYFRKVIVLFCLFVLVACGGDTDSDRVVFYNNIPVANAGADRNAQTGTVTILDGSGSSDADGDTLTYSWSLIDKPSGSASALSDLGIVNPSFTPNVDGIYTLSLVVNDGTADSAACVQILRSGKFVKTMEEIDSGADGVADSRRTYTYDVDGKKNHV